MIITLTEALSCAEIKIFARQSDPKPTCLVFFILFLYFMEKHSRFVLDE